MTRLKSALLTVTFALVVAVLVMVLALTLGELF